MEPRILQIRQIYKSPRNQFNLRLLFIVFANGDGRIMTAETE